jgi:hypothetical protein
LTKKYLFDYKLVMNVVVSGKALASNATEALSIALDNESVPHGIDRSSWTETHVCINTDEHSNKNEKENNST